MIGLSAASAFGETPGATLTPTPAVPTAPAAAGNQLFAAKGVAQVWGRKPEVVEPPPASPSSAPSPATPQPPVTHSPSVQIPSNPTPVAPPVNEAPRAPTEKEKMAAALFGGVGGSSSAAGRRSSGTAQNRRGSAPAPATPPQVQKSDILDLDSSTTKPAPAPTAAPAAATTSAHVFDLLDMDQTLPSPPQVPPQSPPILQNPPVNLMTGGNSAGAGLFDDLIPVSTQASQKIAQQPAT